MSATQYLDPKEVYKDFIEDIKSGKLEKLKTLYNHVAYIKKLTESLAKSEYFNDESLKSLKFSFELLRKSAEKVLGRTEDVLKKLNMNPPKPNQQIPTDIGEAIAKLYEATANMYPGIGDLGKITALIFTLRNTPLHYVKLIYPNIKDDFKILKEYLGLETYRLDANGIKPDESIINDEGNTPGIIGYPDYPRFLQLRETKGSNLYFNITTSETEVKQPISCSQIEFSSSLFRIDFDNCGTQTLGGAISCMPFAIKYLWKISIGELKVEPEYVWNYLTGDWAFWMPYHTSINDYKVFINFCYEIKNSLISLDKDGVYHLLLLHLTLTGADVFLGKAEIAFIRFTNNKYGYVVFR